MVEAVSDWPLTAEVQDQFQANLRGICGGQSDIGKGFSLSTLVFLCQYYSTEWFIFIHQQCYIISPTDTVIKKHTIDIAWMHS
jgi:hypothetical protein